MDDPESIDRIRQSVQDIADGRTPYTPYSPFAPTQPPDLTGAVSSNPNRIARDAFAQVTDVLQRYGLPSSLGTWVWDQIVGGRSEAEVMLELRARPEYRERFKAIVRAEELGLPALSPAQVLEYEQQGRAILKRLGAPAGFYDSPDDFVDQIVAGWSPLELQDAATEAMVRVQHAPQEVRNFYEQWYGVSSAPGAMLALYLDPNKARPVLERMIETAEVGGAGARFGANLNRTQAEELVDLGVDARQAQAGFAQLDEIGSLFDETISEQVDFTLEREGVDAAFGLGRGGQEAIERRRQSRVAAGSGSAGSLLNEEGLRSIAIADQ